MFTEDKEILIAVIASAALMVFLVSVIVLSVIRYQNKARKHAQEISKMKTLLQEEVLKAQVEKEEQTLHRISQEIHDNIGQMLSVAKLNLNTMNIADCQDAVKEKVELTRDLVGNAINDLRNLSKSLNSEHLAKQYLSVSLANELNIVKKAGNFLGSFAVEGNEVLLDTQKQLIIFRIVQEILNNIIKHSEASEIKIELNYGASLSIRVMDNGKGFQPETNLNAPTGTGIRNIYYRAQLIGASCSFKNNNGTAFELHVPLNE